MVHVWVQIPDPIINLTRLISRLTIMYLQIIVFFSQNAILKQDNGHFSLFGTYRKFFFYSKLGNVKCLAWIGPQA